MHAPGYPALTPVTRTVQLRAHTAAHPRCAVFTAQSEVQDSTRRTRSRGGDTVPTVQENLCLVLTAPLAFRTGGERPKLMVIVEEHNEDSSRINKEELAKWEDLRY